MVALLKLGTSQNLGDCQPPRNAHNRDEGVAPTSVFCNLCCGLQRQRLVRVLPGKLGLIAPKVPIGRGFFVNRAQ